ncbi:hypothetical protein GDO81_004844 [Engystomops pustulosus]|uniref:Coiled-coil domain containing 169 n=1 Tax=Engystomops pustulosus TaxID=76066 RepID=A0AAV7CIT8_ENGPU|nr:hypothetical protein GDO81_004844 [Engystomops pustulosus]
MAITSERPSLGNGSTPPKTGPKRGARMKDGKPRRVTRTPGRGAAHTSRMREMLQASIFEMKNTVADLERRLSGVEDEGNEWKTRYETQVELNKQLERQIYALQKKSEYIRGNPTDRLFAIRSYDQMPVGALNQCLKHLEEEMIIMENQLKDFELRIEQEAKVGFVMLCME